MMTTRHLVIKEKREDFKMGFIAGSFWAIAALGMFTVGCVTFLIWEDKITLEQIKEFFKKGKRY